METNSRHSSLGYRTIETPIGSIPSMPLSVKYSKTQQIISEIIEYLPELVDLSKGVTTFRKLQEGKSTYIGEVQDNQKEGIGKQTYNSGMIYYGQYSNNIQNGVGLLLIKNENDWLEYYKGGFSNGSFSGYGEYHCNENYYKGHWEDNLKHGYGKERAGEVYYKGHFNFGSKAGKGKLRGKSGDFKGTFKNDQFNKGKFKAKSKEFVYDGRWKDGKFHGNGKLVYATGPEAKVISGKFQQGILNKGVIKLSDGTAIHLSTRI